MHAARLRLLVILPVVVGSLCFPAMAQGAVVHYACDATQVFKQSTPEDLDHMGQSIAVGGDFNGDGIQDVAFGGYTRHQVTVPPTPETEVTRAFVFFGTGTSPPFGSNQITIVGDAAFDLLGWAVAFIPDVDGDGKDELAVGAPRADVNGVVDAGRVYVFLGRANAATLTASSQADFTLDGPSQDDWFGASIAVAENSAENFADMLVGAPGRGPNSSGYAGCVYQIETPTLSQAVALALGTPTIVPIFVSQSSGGLAGITGSLSTGFVLTAHRILSGSASGDRFGTSIAFVGDLDGVSGQEFLVGAPQYALELESTTDTTGPRYVRLYRLGSATPVVQIDGTQHDGTPTRAAGEAFGFAVAGGVKMDEDSVPDLLIGSPLFDVDKGIPHAVRTDAGRVRAFSGASAIAGANPVAPLLTGSAPNDTLMIGVSGSDQFGYAVGRVGRLDSDDFDEFIIGAWKAPLPTAFCASQNGGDPRTALGGAAFVYSPGSTLTDKVIVKFYGEAFRDHLGRAVATWNLFGTDSFPEIVLSGPAHSDSDFVPEDEEIGRGYVWNGTDVLTPP